MIQFKYTVVSVIFIFMAAALFAQDVVVLRGRVLNTADKKPVTPAVISVAEAKAMVRTNDKGEYRITLPGKGKYSVTIKAAGYQTVETVMTVSGSRESDFWLRPSGPAGGITIVGQRDIQKVSRHTMTVQEIKDVPASFGDSVSALTALPGIIRTMGFFGNLVIRGAPDSCNRYYVDNMPLYNPLHYGGLHSVIANDLMSEIDLYSSAFSAEFGGPTAAVININTVDDVKEFGGYVDLGFLSATALVKIPLNKKVLKDENYEKENKGYVIVSGRYGYLTLFIPLFYEYIMKEDIKLVPEYWDYQIKAKYSFDAKHSLTLLAFGSRDFFKVVSNEEVKNSEDKLLNNFTFGTDTMSFTQGLTYTYRHSKVFSNDLLFYASLTESETSTDMGATDAADWVDNMNSDKPYIFSLKDTLRFKWLDDRAELKVGAEVTVYDFICHGKNFVNKNYIAGMPNFADPNAFDLVEAHPVVNVTVGGYIENKFTYQGLTVTPGVRLDYLQRNNYLIADPRLLVSYEFKSGTTLSASGGMYSSFYQVNPYIFGWGQYIASIGKGLGPEHAAHSVLGIEQKIFLFTIKAEGFFNYFWDVGVSNAYLDNSFDNSGQLMAYGAELMLRLDRTERAAGFFGWINYTFTQSKWKSGLHEREITVNGQEHMIFTDGDRYVNYDYEQEHALKLVLGYTFKQHTISGKFQLYTSFPYTPITGGFENPEGSGRYVPTYWGSETNSKHFPLDHRLDIRYTYTSSHEWGHISWYIEIINVYNNVSIYSETWEYNKEYRKGSNPRVMRDDTTMALIPNFGVEIQF